MTAPLVFMDTGLDRSCEGCGTVFTVRFPSARKRFCGYSCSNRATAMSRKGNRNSRWNNGATSHPLYDTYMDMLGRCNRPTHSRFASYGGRGITVCARWREDFWNFVADMGERPEGLSLDRVDNDGPYSLENCRWATASQQSKNRRPDAYAGLVREPTTGQWRASA